MLADPGGMMPIATRRSDGSLIDLGVRLFRQRTALGIGRAEVARRAGLQVSDIEHLEERPGAQGSREILFSVAKALETTAAWLTGGNEEGPPGTGRAARRPVVETLSVAACQERLQPGGLGRVVFLSEGVPIALPVNFRFHEGAIIFRTAADSSVSHCVDTVVSFEVDRVNEDVSGGWSVLVTGRAGRVEAQERAEYLRLGIEPWAGGYRETFVRIMPDHLSGRAIHPLLS